MRSAAKRTSPHILARQKLLSLIGELMAEGITRLPGERDLCKRLSVSLVTVKKAVRQLSLEGRLSIVPRKGNFICVTPERLNVGIIIGEGQPVTFVRTSKVLGGLLEAFEDGCCHVRLIQLRHPDQAPDFLRQYNIDGCIWYMPEPSLFARIKDVERRCGMPLETVVGFSCADSEMANLPTTLATIDFHAVGRLRAEFLLKRGHGKLACFTSVDTDLYRGFISAVAQAGAIHRRAWCVDGEMISGKVRRILDEGEVTAMVVNGGALPMEKVFQAIDGHEAFGRIELLIDCVGPSTPALLAKYPRLKIIAVNHYPELELGVAAAKMLLGNLRDGLPLVPVRMTSTVRPLATAQSSLAQEALQ